MPSANKLAPRDQSRQFSVKFKNDDTGEVDYINLHYYKHRVTLAPMEARVSEEVRKDLTDEQLEAAKTASTMCTYVKSWDLEGPVFDYDGNEIVGEGEIIPIDPLITMYLPITITGTVMKQLTEEMFPDTSKPQSGRRRSR